MRFVLQEWC